MAEGLNSGGQDSSHLNQDNSEKSLVGKFKSIISNTPLSKWFRTPNKHVMPTIRKRGEEYEEGELQPPLKRTKYSVNLEDDAGVISVKSSDSAVKDKLINRNYNFPEPIAGPSGLHSRKLLNNVNTPIHSDINVQLFGSNDYLNGHKDSDSEESTSGYSSVPMIGSKEHVCQSEGSSKQHSPLQSNSPNRRTLFEVQGISNQTLFMDKSGTSQKNTSMSSRRPHFNSSTFGSPNFFDQTLSTEKVIHSPFYSGSTMYGGASANGNKFNKRAKDLRSLLKTSVHIRPVKKNIESGSMVLGKTARKILETLEQYSTPINDAKKIPVASKRIRLDTILQGKNAGINQFIVPSETVFSKELQVPTVPDLLKLKQKLQNSTEAVRQIATSSKFNLNNVSPKQDISQNFVNTPKLDCINTQGKTVPVQKKPKVNLQEEKHISPSKVDTLKETVSSSPLLTLPKFDLIIPSAPKISDKLPKNPIVSNSIKTLNVHQSSNMENNVQKEPVIVTPYKFSDPVIVSENLKSIVAVNNFKFSEPLTDLNKLESNNVSMLFKAKTNGQTNLEKMSIEKFTLAGEKWECSTCLIRNQKDNSKCIACETPKMKPIPTENKKNSSFGNKFKMPDDMWECNVCMIRNSNDRTKCLACETPNSKSTALVSSSSGFQGNFKPAADTWECSTCLIRNKDDIDKCAACETPRVTTKCFTDNLASTIKKKTDEWECLVCMVRNSNTHMKCVCCEAAKPGNTKLVVQEIENKIGQKFNFGIDKSSMAQFKFGIQPTSTSEISVMNLHNPIVNTSTVPTFTSDTKKKVDSSETSKTDIKSIASSSSLESQEVTPVSKITDLQNNRDAPSEIAVSRSTFSFGSEKIKNVATNLSVSDNLIQTPNPTQTFKFAINKPIASPLTTVLEQDKPVISSNNLDVKSTPTFDTTSKPSPLIESKPFSLKNNYSNGNTYSEVPTISFDQTENVSTKSLTKQPSGLSMVQNTSKSFDFNVGNNSKAVVTQSSGFNFGPSTTTTTSPFGFNFVPSTTANLTANVQSVSNFSFSVAKEESSNVFSGTGSETTSKNGIFNFGSANQSSSSTQKAGFNFGKTINQPMAPFNVAATMATTPGTSATGGGFSFSTTYDLNNKPTFNFTNGPVAFSSQPSVEGVGTIPRKIKKAVRRTQR